MTDDIEQLQDAAKEERITILEATERLATELMRISKRTKMSESGVKDVYSYFVQQEERARMEREQAQMKAAQAARMAEDQANLVPTEVLTGEADD